MSGRHWLWRAAALWLVPVALPLMLGVRLVVAGAPPMVGRGLQRIGLLKITLKEQMPSR